LSSNKVFGCIHDPRSKYIVLGIPLEQTITYKPGTRMAPTTIRDACCNLELYSIIKRKSIEHIGYNDLGDVVVSPGDLVQTFENISRVVKGVVEEYGESIIYILGGEHLITYPVVKALDKYIDYIIVFDAHTDLRDEYLGSRINHATVFRRIIEDFGKEIIYYGVRALSRDEEKYLIDNKMVEVNYIDETSPDNVEELDGSIYISIDMDVFDPSIAPGVGNPEPYGLDTWRFFRIIEKILSLNNNVVGLDIVETNPLNDVNDITSILAAKIILEVTGILEFK